ncbi:MULTISPECIES: divergent polysaccharide deacetylase family protein [unclassified Marinovum]
MARGFLTGALLGVVVAGIGAGTVSVLTGPVLSPRPDVGEAVADGAGAASAPPATEPDGLPKAGVGDGASPQMPSPGIPEPDSGAEIAAGLADTASTGVPETGGAEALSDAPADEDGGTVAASIMDPVAPAAPGTPPARPDADELSISTNPEQPAAPLPSVNEAPPQLGAVPTETGDTPVAPQADTPVTTAAKETAPAANEAEAAPEVVSNAPPAPPTAEETAPATPVDIAEVDVLPSPTPDSDAPNTKASPEAPAAAPAATPPVVATEVAEAPVAPAVPIVSADEETPAVAQTRPQVSALVDRDAEAGRPTIGEPAGTFGNRASGVKTGRLPTLGAETEAEADATPLQRFAVQVDEVDDKPLMAIVLIDDGSTPMGLDALESFPYPITFAVDTSWTGAQEAMRSYRDAGFEVMALANLPTGAQPQDAEVTLSSALAVVPEAVAVLEGDTGGLQENRDVSDQVARILADSGHGLVLYPQGLNTGQAIAARAGVKSATLFRDFDGKGQTATVIRRFLDQAAFKAGQEGAVIMLGRLRAETISALLIWGLQDRASRVAFVPVSHVLMTDATGG